MTEILNPQEWTDSKLGRRDLRNSAIRLRNQLKLYYQTRNLENVDLRFESGGVERLITNKVVGDQQTTYLDPHNGEYLTVLTARGPLGVYSIRYLKHGLELTDLQDTLGAVRGAQGLLAKIFPK